MMKKGHKIMFGSIVIIIIFCSIWLYFLSGSELFGKNKQCELLINNMEDMKVKDGLVNMEIPTQEGNRGLYQDYKECQAFLNRSDSLNFFMIYMKLFLIMLLIMVGITFGLYIVVELLVD